jgi:hypothetical protein
MSLDLKIIALAQAIGADIKSINANSGSLSSLTTSAKTNLVAAINEIKSIADDAGVKIDDLAVEGAAGKLVVWSADKVSSSITAAKTSVKNEILDGAGEALDTLKELAAALGNDPNFATTIANEMGKRVRFDAAQTLTEFQKKQACGNIGVGDPEHNFVADYNTAKA